MLHLLTLLLVNFFPGTPPASPATAPVPTLVVAARAPLTAPATPMARRPATAAPVTSTTTSTVPDATVTCTVRWVTFEPDPARGDVQTPVQGSYEGDCSTAQEEADANPDSVVTRVAGSGNQ